MRSRRGAKRKGKSSPLAVEARSPLATVISEGGRNYKLKEAVKIPGLFFALVHCTKNYRTHNHEKRLTRVRVKLKQIT
jgi:hypothetical protein